MELVVVPQKKSTLLTARSKLKALCLIKPPSAQSTAPFPFVLVTVREPGRLRDGAADRIAALISRHIQGVSVQVQRDVFAHRNVAQAVTLITNISCQLDDVAVVCARERSFQLIYIAYRCGIICESGRGTVEDRLSVRAVRLRRPGRARVEG